MKACVLEDIKIVKYKEIEKPKIKSNEVLLKVKACGICSSDIDRVYLSGAYHYPIVLGHEISGQIVDANDISKDLIGKKAVVFPLLPCMQCESCKSGNYAQCYNYNYFGSRCDGGFSEYLAVPNWNIKVFNDDISYENAALCEPAAVAWHALSKIVEPQNGQFARDILIVGSGIIGIIIALWAKKFNLDVTFLSRNNRKTQFLNSLGFMNIINSDSSKNFDVCFECVGTEESLGNVLDFVKPMGKIILVGNPKKGMTINKKLYWKILRQEIKIEGIWNSKYPTDWDWVLAHIKELPYNKLITHKFQLSDAFEAFEMMTSNQNFKLKGMYINE